MIKRALFTTAAAAVAGLAFSDTAEASGCAVDQESVWDMSAEQVEAFYECMAPVLARCYAQDGHDIGSVYRDWTVTSTRPAVAGPHDERLLQTFANDIAAEEYLKFASQGVNMPAGSVLAKESFSISNGEGVVGPLFIMTKLEDGESPDTGNWYYSALNSTGGKMGVSQSFCHDCHVAWEAQDMLAYPLEEVRVSN